MPHPIAQAVNVNGPVCEGVRSQVRKAPGEQKPHRREKALQCFARTTFERGACPDREIVNVFQENIM
eukprot:scaffold17142_cov131-Isochrysis_galbana.AAC.2